MRASVFALGLITALGAGAAVAGDRAGGMLQRIDSDGDGSVSRAEALAFRATRFARLDADGDGRVTRAEMDNRARGRGAGRVAKRFEKLDTNGDGAVDRAEFDARADRQFRRLDSDGDGRLTEQELRAMRARHRRDG